MTAGRIAVVHGLGSATLTEIAMAAEGLAELVFVLGADPRSADIDGLAAELGHVVRLDDGVAVEATHAELSALDVTGVVTFCDLGIPVAADIAARLGLPCHTPTTAAALVDKLRQRRALNAAGVAPVAVAPLDVDNPTAALRQVGVPAVLKPRRGAASVNTVLIHGPTELTDTLDRLRAAGVPLRDAFLLEEYLPDGPTAPGLASYLSVETACRDGVYLHLAVTDRLPSASGFRETGASLPARLAPEPARGVRDLAEAALRALGVRHGLTHTEIKLTPAGPRILEVNGRLGGNIHRLITHVSDTSPIRLALEVSLGRPDALVPPTYHGAAGTLFVAPPHDAVRVRFARGRRELLTEPGIWAVDDHCADDAPVDLGKGTLAHARTVWVDAADHERLRHDLPRLVRLAADSVAWTREPMPAGSRS
ncbi:ATP-grasp domain-containing protein [Micromonospora sp. DT62]|uniref:ATP-grasp domain-containing protein n=1 Tax=Micromonospora sp. DT62 TaxID=3416521 RepID=UPI003CFAAC80